MKQEQFKSLMCKASQFLDASSPRQACLVVEQALKLPDCAQSAECLSLLRKIGECGVATRVHSAWTLRALEGHGFPVYSVGFSNDGRFLLSAGVDNEIRVWNLADGGCIQTLRGHTNTVTAAAFSNAEKCIVSGSFDNSVRVWDLQSGECLVQLDDLGHARVVAFSPDRQLVFVGGGEFIFTAWEIRTGRNVQRITHGGFDPTALAISSDGRRALVGNYQKTVSFWDLANAQCLHTFDLRYPTATATALAPGGAVGASTSNDGILRLWDLRAFRCLKEIRAADAGVGGNCALCFTPDGRFVISAASTVRLWGIGDALDQNRQRVSDALKVYFSSQGVC